MDSRHTVLIIEDDKISRSILSNKLSDNYIVYQADNGEDGLKILRQHPDISIILLDILMPVMDGYEFLSIIRHNDLFANIPVVVITGNFSEEEEMKCLELGATDFLSKPYNPVQALARVRNVIQLEEASHALQEMEMDELTGLYTKQAFLHYAMERVEANPDTDYAILGFNIENFKAANNQYGERLCDEFLAYIGKQVRKVSGTGIAGRFSGDQFVLLFDNDERTTIDRIEQVSRVIFQYAPIPHQIAKVGVYAPIDRNLEMTRCCDRAFMAIREVKGVYHKNVAFYEDRMREQMMNEQRIQDSMEEALKDEQFMVYYQPKHESISGEIAGAEALIRWKHPEFGFMQPSKFVPIFERNGFITYLDHFVLEKVCQDISDWKKRGMPVVPISINISRRDYLEEGWIDDQIAMIDAYGIDHSLIHMEVTESLYAENTSLIIDQVRKLQERGFLIEMDDFGAGYSSLGMLATFPLDIIKLDISFVRSIELNRVVIENIIKLAHKMGYKTVAEGAETIEQYQVLRDLECDFIQGYYYSKPIDHDKYERYVKMKVDLADQIGDIFGRKKLSKEDSDIFTASHDNMRINSLLSVIESLEENSSLDELTGFKNRKSYYEEIRAIEQDPQRREQSIGMVYVDVNGLKSINDNFGHEAGDRLIVHIAGILRSVFLTADIYRIGGDEFMIFSRDVSDREFYEKVRRLNARWTNEESASVGCVWLNESKNIEQYMVSVDKKMYQEKRKYYEKKFHDRRRGQRRVMRNLSDEAWELIFHNMADLLPCGLFVYKMDDEEELVLCNRKLVEMFGCKNENELRDHIGNSFKGMVHPEDLERVQEEITEQISNVGDVDYVSYRIICKDGNTRVVTDYGRFIHSERYGNVYAVMINFADE